MIDTDKMRYFVSTYTPFSHNYLVAILSSNDVKYQYQELQNEETFSKFEILSDINIYNTIKDLMSENNGTAITIEYGAY
jgi:NADH pyrophosphatase NudC (nudix superfamily)